MLIERTTVALYINFFYYFIFYRGSEILQVFCSDGFLNPDVLARLSKGSVIRLPFLCGS